MSVYRADLTGAHHHLIAHLLPGDRLHLTWSLGEKVINGDPDFPWLEAFDDRYGPRGCRFVTGTALAQKNHRVRQRPPITAAVKALRRGGVAYVEYEMRQETNKFNEPFGPPVRLPAGHVLVTPELVKDGAR